jgi:hypothetical protein
MIAFWLESVMDFSRSQCSSLAHVTAHNAGQVLLEPKRHSDVGMIARPDRKTSLSASAVTLFSIEELALLCNARRIIWQALLQQ